MKSKIENIEKNLEQIKDYYYNDNMSANQIANIYGCKYGLIIKILKKNSCVLKTSSQIHRKFDENVFENIDSEEKAYWLGYLYADGCVRIKRSKHKNGKIYTQHCISLVSIDEEVIIKFKKFIKSTGKLKKYTNNSRCNSSYYMEIVSSFKMFKDLEDKNCKPNKTLDLFLPENVPDDLIRHFIRGYFDGDGSVYISKTKNNSLNPYKGKDYYESLHVNIISTYNFCKYLRYQIFLENSKNIYKEKRIKQDNIYYLKFDSKKCEIFYNYIYKDSNVFLQRKKNKFDEYYSKKGSTTIISNPTQ